VTVIITGALEGPALDGWRRLIGDAVAMRPSRLVLDLVETPSIDAAAIVLLLQVHRELVVADAQLVLRGPVPRVRRMLSLAHVDRVFDIEAASGDRDGLVARPGMTVPPAAADRKT
jgi:anti-anti-sigma factor